MNKLRGKIAKTPIVLAIITSAITHGYAQNIDKIISEHSDGFYRAFHKNIDCDNKNGTYTIQGETIQNGKIISSPGEHKPDISWHITRYCNFIQQNLKNK